MCCGNPNLWSPILICHLHRVPRFPITYYRQLKLARNSVSEISGSLGRLSRLKQLKLDSNLLSSFPKVILQLTQLEHLEIRYNSISEVPAGLARLTQLTWLLLEGNPLISPLPFSQGQLTSLRNLDLGDTGIVSTPPFIAQLTRLTSLQLFRNSLMLSSVPQFVSQLTELDQLYLDNCGLTTIPPSVLAMSSLRLNLEGNNISFATMSALLSTVGSAANPTNPPTSLLLLGNNPACVDGGGFPPWVGPWKIKCEPECAASPCTDTGTEERSSFLSDGGCDRGCDTASCQWDGGDCQALWP